MQGARSHARDSINDAAANQAWRRCVLRKTSRNAGPWRGGISGGARDNVRPRTRSFHCRARRAWNASGPVSVGAAVARPAGPRNWRRHAVCKWTGCGRSEQLRFEAKTVAVVVCVSIRLADAVVRSAPISFWATWSRVEAMKLAAAPAAWSWSLPTGEWTCAVGANASRQHAAMALAANAAIHLWR